MTERDRVTGAGLLVIGGAAAVMSFAALSDLAELRGIDGTARVPLIGWTLHLAWLLPITVDVFAALATRVWLRREAHPDAIRFACGATWAAVGATVLGNAYHGYLTSSGALDAVLIASVPAVAIGAAVHLAVLVGRPVRAEEAEEAEQPTDEELAQVSEAAGVPVVRQSARAMVYRLYGESGDLLYVGVTQAMRTRMAAHRRDKAWWPEVANTVVRTYATREQALAVEHSAIENENPKYNIMPGINPALLSEVSPTTDSAKRATDIGPLLNFLSPDAAKHAERAMQILSEAHARGEYVGRGVLAQQLDVREHVARDLLRVLTPAVQSNGSAVR